MLTVSEKNNRKHTVPKFRYHAQPQQSKQHQHTIISQPRNSQRKNYILHNGDSDSDEVVVESPEKRSKTGNDGTATPSTKEKEKMTWKKRSYVWEHFLEVDKQVKCKHCSFRVDNERLGSSTSNLAWHLRSISQRHNNCRVRSNLVRSRRP